MGLLEKALRGSNQDSLPSSKSSLYARAIAAASETSRKIKPATRVVSSPAFTLDDLRSLKSELSALPRTFDIYLTQWSKISSVLRLSSFALFLPSGTFLLPVARIGFPSCPPSPVSSSLAERVLGCRGELDEGSAAALSTALGLSSPLSLRASSVFIGPHVAALWVYRDASLESCSGEFQTEVVSLFSSGVAGDYPLVPILPPIVNPDRFLFDTIIKAARSFVFSFDLSLLYEEISKSHSGVSADLLRSSFTAACTRVLAPEGSAVVYGTMRTACVLPSSSSSDHELALFQFLKSLRRLLPSFPASSFPKGRSTVIDSQSDAALSELTRFLQS